MGNTRTVSDIALEDPSELGWRVPLLLCSPKQVVSELQVPGNIVTSHKDALPSLLEDAAQPWEKSGSVNWVIGSFTSREQLSYWVDQT